MLRVKVIGAVSAAALSVSMATGSPFEVKLDNGLTLSVAVYAFDDDPVSDEPTADRKVHVVGQLHQLADPSLLVDWGGRTIDMNLQYTYNWRFLEGVATAI